MARLSKCKSCGIELQKKDRNVYSGKTYCKKCYDLKVSEKNQYNNLIKTICNYFEINKPTGLILKQIKDYKEQFDYTYSGMQYTLWYCKDILGKSFEIKYGIALVKYQYENSKDYFLKQQQINKSVVDFKIKEVVKKVKINKSNRKSFTINLDELK